MKTTSLFLVVAALLSIGPASGTQEVRERATFRGHRLGPQQVAISPDGKLLASGGGDNEGAEVKLWDVDRGKERASLEGHKNRIEALTFSPDGKRLASAEDDGTIQVWDVAVAKSVATFAAETYGSFHALAFSPDGKRLAAAGDTQAKLWDVASGKELSSFSRKVRAHQLAFSHDLRTLAAPNYEDMDLWDVATGKERSVLPDHRDVVGAVVFSGDDRTLVVTSRSEDDKGALCGEIKIWDVPTGRERGALKGDFGWIQCLALSPDGKTLALVDLKDLDGDCVLKVLDAPSGKLLLQHQGIERCFSTLAFLENGTLWVAGTVDPHDVKLWEVRRPGKGP